MLRIACITILLANIGMSDIFAQVPDMEWKKIDKSNLEMTKFEADTNASAVVLFDKGHVSMDYNLDLVMERHVRIKILDKKGFDKASISLSYRDDLEQDISKIRGFTYYLEDEDIERVGLRGKDIFEDEISDLLKVKKFTMPRVQPGVIIEYKYKKEIGDAYLMPDWTFQRDIPVKWSKYTAELPQWFNYSQYLQGDQLYYIDDIEAYSRVKSFGIEVDPKYNRESFQRYTAKMGMRKYRWIMKDVPALERQPYVSTLENFRAKLLLQLFSIKYPGQETYNYMESWEKLIENLLNDKHFGERLESSDLITDYANTVTDSIADTTEKIQALYSNVANSIDWNNEHGFLVKRSLTDVLKSKHGDGAEINLLLVQLLREIDLNANPVFLSTKDHGKIVRSFPFTQQFNHVICVAEHDGDHYLLDAKNPDRAMGLLAENDLNGKGLIIEEGKVNWIDLENRTKTKKVISMVAEIKKDGSLEGEISEVNTGYEAVKKRDMIEEDGSKEYAREYLLGNLLQVKIDTIEATNLDSPELPLKTASTFTAKGNTRMVSDYLYINPNFLMRRTENPFKDVDRKYPVNFPHIFRETFTLNLKIPEGYTVNELPKSRILRLPDRAAEFKWLAQKNGNQITIVNNFSINKRVFQVGEYEYLKKFYTQLVKAQERPLVLEKNDKSSK